MSAPNATASLMTVALSCLFFTACGSTLWEGHLARITDDWSFEITEYKDGPNRWNRPDNTTFVPADGERFLWVRMKIRNNSSRPRPLNVQTCSMDLDGQAILPVLSLYDGFIVGQMDMEKDFGPGEEIQRRVAYSYPEKRWPRRLTCAGVDFPLAEPK